MPGQEEAVGLQSHDADVDGADLLVFGHCQQIVGDVLGPLLGGIRRAWNLDRKQAATVQDDGVFAIRGRTRLPSR